MALRRLRIGVVLGAALLSAIAAPVARCVTLPPWPNTLSKQARAQLSAMNSSAATNTAKLSLAQIRVLVSRIQDTIGAAQRKQYTVTIKDAVIAGVRVRIITPASRPPDPERVLLNLHGGGFQVDSGSLTENIPIAALTGMRVIAVLYRLSPEYHFPAAVNDALAVYRSLLKTYEPDHIAIYGTSAGAVLGPELMARVIRDGLPVPAALGVFSGDTDLARPGDSERLFPFSMGGESLAQVTADYVGKMKLTNPLVSPLYGSLKRFPPTLCVTSERDFLLSATANFCRRLGEEGVQSNTIVFDGLPHAFWSYIIAPESDEAFADMAEFLEKKLGVSKGDPPAGSRSLIGGYLEAPPDSLQRCAALSKVTLPFTQIFRAVAVPAGPFKGHFLSTQAQLPAHCRVEGRISPELGSDIRFEVWMPLRGWNGRLYGAGNGGFAGAIAYPDLGVTIQRGAAGVSTDTGHEAKSPEAAEDGSWALGHPARIRDYGYRAIHLSTLAAKSLLRVFYGRPAAHAYFASCSNGGREALMEAERYPSDYNGIIAGAPAYDFTGVTADFIWNTQAQERPGATIPASSVPALQAAVRKACPQTDAMRGNPRLCKFNPKVLSCRRGDNGSCLTEPQVAALRKIYAGPHNSHGVALYPGFPATGDELGSPPGWGWDGWILPLAGAHADEPTYADAVLADFGTTLTAGISDFNFDRDYPILKAELAPILDATDPNLERFARGGGKLIMWQGWADAALPPEAAINYFNAVRARIGPRTANEMMRLYMAPGVDHCFGGPGGNSFDQWDPPSPPAQPHDDMAAALQRWVEGGIAPGPIVAHHASPSDVLSGATNWRLADGRATSLLCPYPKVAVYRGTGDRNAAISYRCGVPRAAPAREIRVKGAISNTALLDPGGVVDESLAADRTRHLRLGA